MRTALPAHLQQTAERVRDAHKTVIGARDKHKKLAHRRNLAVLTLVLQHRRKKAPTLASAGLGRSNWVEIEPSSPIPPKLPAWSAEQAEQVIAKVLKAIADLDQEERDAREARIKGLAELAAHQVDGEPLTNAAIADYVDMSEALVGQDLAKAADAAGTPADDAGLVPVAILAKRLRVPVKEVLKWIEYARENGIEVPRTALGGSKVLLVDEEAFVGWWEAHKFGWLAPKQLAERYGMSYEKLRQRLDAARARGTAPESVAFGPRTVRYNPKAADAWNRAYEAGGKA